MEKLKTDHENAIKIAKARKPNIGVFKEQVSKEGICSRLVGYGNNKKEEVAEKLAHSLGMFANIGAHLATFTAMEKDLTLGVISLILYYCATFTALSVASIGCGIAAAAYGIYIGVKWIAESGVLEPKADINIADECIIKANKVFSNSQNVMQYTCRQSKVHKLGNAFDDEGVSESDSSYLVMVSGNDAEQETNMAEFSRNKEGWHSNIYDEP